MSREAEYILPSNNLWRSSHVHAAQLCLFAYTAQPQFALMPIMVHPHADALFRPNLGISLPPGLLLLSHPTTSLCECHTHHSIAVMINILRVATSAIIPVLPESYTFLPVRCHPLGMFGNALSLARAGRNL
jgi:hypothetical protein